MYDWLQELKAGDKIIHRWYGVEEIKKVDRVTKAQVMVDRLRFWKKDGYEVGRQDYKSRIRQATPGVVEELKLEREKMQLIASVNNLMAKLDVRGASVERLRHIEACLKSE